MCKEDKTKGWIDATQGWVQKEIGPNPIKVEVFQGNDRLWGCRLYEYTVLEDWFGYKTRQEAEEHGLKRRDRLWGKLQMGRRDLDAGDWFKISREKSS